MKWLAAAVLLMGGAARAEPPTSTEMVLLAAAETTLAIDGLQTLRIAIHPPGVILGPDGIPRLLPGYAEANPLLGATPSVGVVAVYFSSAMLLTAAGWYSLPKTRLVLPIAVLALESAVIVHNGFSMGWRFGF